MHFDYRILINMLEIQKEENILSIINQFYDDRELDRINFFNYGNFNYKRQVEKNSSKNFTYYIYNIIDRIFALKVINKDNIEYMINLLKISEIIKNEIPFDLIELCYWRYYSFIFFQIVEYYDNDLYIIEPSITINSLDGIDHFSNYLYILGLIMDILESKNDDIIEKFKNDTYNFLKDRNISSKLKETITKEYLKEAKFFNNMSYTLDETLSEIELFKKQDIKIFEEFTNKYEEFKDLK